MCYIKKTVCSLQHVLYVLYCLQVCPSEKCFQSVAELSAVQKHYEGVRKIDYSHPKTLLNSFLFWFNYLCSVALI